MRWASLFRVFDVANEPRARRQGHARLVGKLARFVLQTEGTHVLRLRSDEHDAGVFACIRKIRIFRQEAVARMNGFRAGCLGGVEDRVELQIAFGSRRGTDGDGFARLHDVHRMAIGFGIDGDARNAHPIERPDDAAGNGATVGDQHFAKHVRQAPLPQMRTSIGVGL